MLKAKVIPINWKKVDEKTYRHDYMEITSEGDADTGIPFEVKNTMIKRLYADRKKRYYGKSKLSLKALFIHAFRINCVFLYRVIFVSFSYLFLIFYLNTFFFNLLILPIITFNFFSLIIFFQTNSKEYLHSKDLIKNVVVVK